MLVNLMQTMTSWLSVQVYGSDSLPMLVAKLPYWSLELAVQVRDTNLWGQVQGAWNHFVQTGQIWAMIIGLILGYFIKGFTTFG
ncbi:MAG: hypothetical protein U7127_16000 [Phormidium sp.]